LAALNAVERLSVLSQSILEGVDEGEAYETLCRRLRTLHRNIMEISEMADAAKTNPTKETA